MQNGVLEMENGEWGMENAEWGMGIEYGECGME